MADPLDPTQNREKRIFLEALEFETPEERNAHLEESCGDDPVLKAAIRDLLRNHLEDNFLETSPSARIRQEVVDSLPAMERTGDLIGRYKLLQQIGEGGCGVVYLAEQEQPVRRRVALKVIKLGMDTRSVVARFEAERQALAMMDHPNIARVLDGGATPAGRPYFVMELVQGCPITQFCEENSLTVEERLELFNKVCNAVQHAHQKGIIHRDLKPSNIMVTTHDHAPVPKVIDFGIVKAIEQRLTDKTILTEFQVFVGTPAYTSPEQAEMRSMDIDTRTDIYSLGVLLYELLTGETPFPADRLIRSGLSEMRRIILEEEPELPSSKLARRESPGPRDQRPSQLAKRVREDLDWIVMKCLEKDRTRRYETANALGLDVQRHLNLEPISARPPTRSYRVQKFVRRHQVPVLAATAVFVILIAAIVVSTLQAVRANRATREQSRLRAAAEASRQDELQQRRRAQQEAYKALQQAYDSDLNLAQQALAANNLGMAVTLLERHRPGLDQPELRGWEWRYLWGQCQNGAAFRLPKQSGAVEQLLISPDGRWLVSSVSRGETKLWNLARREEVRILQSRGAGSRVFCFNPAGTLLAISGAQWDESVIKVWDLQADRVVARLPMRGFLHALSFGSDTNSLLAFAQSNSVLRYALQTQRLEHEFKASRGSLGRPGRSAVFSSGGALLAWMDNNQIRILNTATEQELQPIQVGAMASIAFSPDGKTLASSPHFFNPRNTIHLFNTETGEESGQLVGHNTWVPDVSFFPDGRKLVSAGSDQTIRLWDLQTHQELALLRGHVSEVGAVAVSPDGHAILSGSKEGEIYGWEAVTPVEKEAFTILPGKTSRVEFVPRQGVMLSLGSDGAAVLWDTSTMQEKGPLPGLHGIDYLKASKDGSRIFALRRDGHLVVFDWATQQVVTNLLVGSRRVFGNTPSPWTPPANLVEKNGVLVVAIPGSSRRELNLTTWTWQTPAPEPGNRNTPNSSTISEDGSMMARAGTDGTFELVELGSGRITPLSEQPVVGAFSPDNTLFAAGNPEGFLVVWDCKTGTRLGKIKGHLLAVHQIFFDAKGERLVSLGYGNEAVKLWDVATLSLVATLPGKGTIFSRGHFSPDGKQLIAINVEGQAHVWTAPTLAEISALESARNPGSDSKPNLWEGVR